MNDKCPACEKEWLQGDSAIVIGMIHRDQTASLVFVHRECIMIDVLGEDMAKEIIARERKGDN